MMRPWETIWWCAGLRQWSTLAVITHKPGRNCTYLGEFAPVYCYAATCNVHWWCTWGHYMLYMHANGLT